MGDKYGPAEAKKILDANWCSAIERDACQRCDGFCERAWEALQRHIRK